MRIRKVRLPAVFFTLAGIWAMIGLIAAVVFGVGGNTPGDVFSGTLIGLWAAGILAALLTDD